MVCGGTRETVFGSDGNEKIGDMDVFICRKCGKVRREKI